MELSAQMDVASVAGHASKSENRSNTAARREFDGYADSVLLTEPEVAAVVGHSPHTLKYWRLNNPAKAPKATKVFDAVRYAVRDVRAWLRSHEPELV
jgi:hypothetical protein